MDLEIVVKITLLLWLVNFHAHMEIALCSNHVHFLYLMIHNGKFRM
jgi:hypothetical protein